MAQRNIYKCVRKLLAKLNHKMKLNTQSNQMCLDSFKKSERRTQPSEVRRQNLNKEKKIMK